MDDITPIFFRRPSADGSLLNYLNSGYGESDGDSRGCEAFTPEEHQNRSISEVVAYARESEARFAGMEITKSLQPADRLRLPVRKAQGQQTTRLGFGVKKKIQPAFKKIGIKGVGWHTFRHTVGTMLPEMGEHQLMIRDYLRHANLHVTNKYLQATTQSKRLAQGKLVDAILPGGVLSGSKSTLIH